jgi:glycosyltransferase involved in cell wall biosynthesis
MPRVSIVVLNYNHANFLRQRLDSVLRQTFQDFELLLLDDCSTDDSQIILSELAGNPKVRLELNDKNSGSTFKQWNKGVKLARGEYIWLAESDDYADVHFLERLVPALDAEPSAQFAFCRSWRVDRDGRSHGFVEQYLAELSARRWAADYCSEGKEDCRDYFIFRNIVANASAVVFRKATYELVGGADESFRMCGDWKLWASMALTGKVVYLQEPLNFFRFHDRSVRGSDLAEGLLAQESLRVVRWLLTQVSVSIPVRDRLYVRLGNVWILPFLSRRVGFKMKWSILKNAAAIDPHAIRRLIRQIWVILKNKFSRQQT